MYQHLLDSIAQRTVKIGVIGLGYVGLPLAMAWAQAGFAVTGVDSDPQRVDLCRQGISWVTDISSAELSSLIRSGQMRATTEMAVLENLDVITVCVPTPLNKTKDPDVSIILEVVDTIAAQLRPGQFIILESTTYPGTTEELVLPRLSRNGLCVGQHFFLAFSPERTDPANPNYTLSNTPKVVSGVTSPCREAALALYSTIVEHVIPISSPRSAEFVKLLENTFRAVNIGLVNEMAMIANMLNIDIWEVIDAARTKPFGFMPFYPGPGIGGHCIPIDPHYLSWKARMLNYRARFIEVASDINGQMPWYVVDLVTRALNDAGKCLNGSRILLIGVAYKPDVNDVRESPAIDIIQLLLQRKAHVEYADPYVPLLNMAGRTLKAVQYDRYVAEVDCVVIVTNHSAFDYGLIAKNALLIVDTRNSMAKSSKPHIWKL